MGVLRTRIRSSIDSLSMFCLGYADHKHVEAMMVHNISGSCSSDHWGRISADLAAPVATAPRRGWRVGGVKVGRRVGFNCRYLVPNHPQLGIL